MMNSIENRSPFLDTELVKDSINIKNENMIQNGYAKFILREAAKGYLTNDVRLFRRKVGFNSNLGDVLDEKFNLTNFLENNKILNNLLNIKKIDSFYKKVKYKNSENKFIFSLINLKIFLDNYA